MVSPTTDRRQGLVGNTPLKAPVTVLAASNITLSGQQTIDGVAVLASNASGVPDRVLCTAQTVASQNGIWDVSTGSWTRSKDANGNYDLVQGSTVLVNSGTTYAGQYWKVATSGPITIGTTSLSWTQALTSALSAISFTQSGSGAVSRDGQSKMREVFSVFDFMTPAQVADVQASTLTLDLTQAMQTAINAAPAGSLVYVGTGSFKYSQLTINKSLSVRGAGKYSTYLVASSGTSNSIVVTATSAVELADLNMSASVTRTGGASVIVDPAAGSNFDSAFRRIQFANQFVAINFVDASDFTIEDCYFASYISEAVKVANVASPDSGDSLIFNCTFDAGSGTGNAISQTSSGGLRILSNKFLGGNFHYLGTYNSAPTNTSILLIQGNSMEHAKTSSVALNGTTPTTFSFVIVENNHITVSVASATGFTVTDAGYDFLSDVVIGGNIFNLGANATAMNLGRGQRISLMPNTIRGAATTNGVIFGANVGAVTVHPQDMSGVTTRFNGTMTNVTFLPGGLVQTGTGNPSTNAAYGTLFITATQTVTFATAYPKAPAVSIYATPAGTVSIGVLKGNVTTTGFDYRVIGTTNATACPVEWTASGG